MIRLFERVIHRGHGRVTLHRVRWRTGPIRNPYDYWTRLYAFGLLFNSRAWWVGAHYSKHDKRLCVNLIPCFTVWVTLPGGMLP